MGIYGRHNNEVYMRFEKIESCIPRCPNENTQDALMLVSRLSFDDDAERTAFLAEQGIPADSTVTIRGSFNVLRTNGIYQDPLISIDGRSKKGTPIHRRTLFAKSIKGGIEGAIKFFTHELKNYAGPFGQDAHTLLLAAFGAGRA
jgi:hypothetical protein